MSRHRFPAPRRRLRGLVAILAAFTALFGLAACDSTASPDMIGVVVGSGKDGNDAKIHNVIYPGQTVNTNSASEVVNYFPGNSRDYVIDNRDSGNPDRKTPAVGYTKQHTQVAVYLSAFWTVNQDKNILQTKFYPYCAKYGCSETDPTIRNDRSSTDGWVKMLDAGFGPAIDDTVRQVMPTIDDEVWKEQKGWPDLATAISDNFDAAIRARTGYTDDLFCGSGDVSGWTGDVGASTFNCGKIRFTITSVVATNSDQQQAESAGKAATQQKEANAEILAAAKAKYGDRAGEVLGRLDSIAACKNAGQTCVVVLGGDGSTSVSVPR